MNNILALQPETWYEKINRLYNKSNMSVTFQVTEDCCMACTYCYQHHKTKNKMTWDIAKITIDKLLDNNLEPLSKFDNYQTLIYEFIGGEPLMEIDLIEQICEYTINKMIELRHPWLPHFRATICSNGLLYFSPKVQEFLQKYNNFINFTFSVDGNAFLHDSCRVDLQGKGTYNKIIQAIYHYRKNYGNINNTKMTISTENIFYLSDALINLIKENFLEIFVNCVYEEGWNYSYAKILYEQLNIVADYLIDNNLYNKVYIRFFKEDSYEALPESNNSNWCGGIITDSDANLSIDYKGDLYPCLRYMESSLNGKQKPLKLGNINTGYGITEEEKNNINLLSNITRRSQSTDECFYCPIASGCSWCSGYNYEEFGTPNKRAIHICCMHQAASLSNVYLINKIYHKLNYKTRYKMNIPKEWALNIIDQDEYNYLLKLSQE